MSAADIERYLQQTRTTGGMAGAPKEGHVGYVALLGRPNTGKSTLLNGILGYRLTAVTYKPQTTRKRWLGIVTDEDSQVLFLDTPGVHKPLNELGTAMNASVVRALADADVVVVMADPTRALGQEDTMVASAAYKCHKPLLLAINKNDVTTPEDAATHEQFYRACDGNVFYLTHQGQVLRDTVLGMGDNSKPQVPHSVAVTVENWKENRGGCTISASLHVERKSQKGILIGKGGESIKKIRIGAERLLKDQLQKPVKLSLFVKVTQNWRKKKQLVEPLIGY